MRPLAKKHRGTASPFMYTKSADGYQDQCDVVDGKLVEIPISG